MAKKEVKRPNLMLLGVYLVALVALFLIFKPFITYLLTGVVIVIFMHPVNKWVHRFVKNSSVSASLMIIIVLLIILIPSFFISTVLVKESARAYNALKTVNLTEVEHFINLQLNSNFSLEKSIIPSTSAVTGFLSQSITSFFSAITLLLINLFIMFFFMYYGFKEGDKLLEGFLEIIPIKKLHKKLMVDETKKVLYGVMYGQFLVSLIQGVLGGIGFWIFGIQNPILWGFVMAVLAFIPFLGTPIVWLPAIIIELSKGNYFAGIGLLLFSGIIVAQIDNVIKPKIIGSKTSMHPFLVLIGIFGGIALFGIIGFIIGPVIVALCSMAIKFFNEEIASETV